jgi:hypothetical protein
MENWVSSVYFRKDHPEKRLLGLLFLSKKIFDKVNLG